MEPTAPSPPWIAAITRLGGLAAVTLALIYLMYATMEHVAPLATELVTAVTRAAVAVENLERTMGRLQETTNVQMQDRSREHHEIMDRIDRRPPHD